MVAANTWTMVLFGAIVGFATFAGTALGSIAAGLDMSLANVAATCILLTLIGIIGGALTLAITAGTGSKKAGVFGAIGVMAALHVLNSMGEISNAFEGIQPLSPFYYYLGNDPLHNGMDWSHAAVLTTIAIVLIAVSFPLFQRRDIRQRD